MRPEANALMVVRVWWQKSNDAGGITTDYELDRREMGPDQSGITATGVFDVSTNLRGKILRTCREDSERAAKAIEVLRGKWTLDILCELRRGPVRLGKLTRTIPGASKKAITSSLRWLELCGLVIRRDLTQSILHVEYELETQARESIGSLLDYLANWSSSLPDRETAPTKVDVESP